MHDSLPAFPVITQRTGSVYLKQLSPLWLLTDNSATEYFMVVRLLTSSLRRERVQCAHHLVPRPPPLLLLAAPPAGHLGVRVRQ
jgi:hypothetical protein